MDLSPALNSVLDLTDRWRKEECYPLFPVVTESGTTRARVLPPRTADGQANAERTGRDVTVLGSADYLGLAQHAEVQAAAIDAVRRFGTGTYGTQAVGGFTALHEELEATVADYFGRPAALLFPTGAQANVGLLATLLGPGDTVLGDRLNHGSLVMGARLSGARLLTFRHNDTAHLAELLASTGKEGRRLVVVDGLFSADGDIAPLPRIVELAREYDALLVVDEAHSAGTLGPEGRGTAELLGVQEQVDVVTGTFSKAFASTGGFVCAGPRLVDALRHAATTYLLSLGLPPATVAAALAAFRLLSREGAQRRRTLADRAAFLRTSLRAAGVDIAGSEAHVVVVPTGSMDRNARVTSRLADSGLLVCPLFPPAVPIGGARLRLGVTAAHTERDLADASRLIAAALSENA